MPSGFPSRFNTTARAMMTAIAALVISGTLTLSSMTAGSILFAGTSGVVTQDNASLFFDDTNNRVGLLTTAPTHTLTFGSTSTGLTEYNTADQTTNYERGTLAFSSNVFLLSSLKAGSGTARNIQVLANNAAGTVWGGATGQITNTAAISTGAGPAHTLTNGSSFSSTTLVQDSLLVSQTVNQASGTGGYRGIVVNPTLTAVGSTGANLLVLQAASTNKFRVDSTGNVVVSSAATSGVKLFNTADETTNTEAGSLAWSSNALKLTTSVAGSGTNRDIQITAGAGYSALFSADGSSTLTSAITTGSQVGLTITNGTWSSTSLVQDAVNITGTVNQASGTGGFRGLVVNPTLTAVGSTGANLLVLQAGGTNKWRVDSTGNQVVSSTATSGIVLHNQTDETTNFEKGNILWSSNILTISTVKGGSGTNRSIAINAANATTATFGSNGVMTLSPGIGGTATTALAITNSGVSFTGSSGQQNQVSIVATVNQTSTAAWTGLLINPTLTAIGSGGGNFVDFQSNTTSLFRVDTNGKITMSATNTTVGTTGNQTINKPSGTVNVAATGTAVTVTNSTVSATSIVTAIARTNDTTCYVKNVVPGSGTFTINLTGACAAETSFGFVVVN